MTLSKDMSENNFKLFIIFQFQQVKYIHFLSIVNLKSRSDRWIKYMCSSTSLLIHASNVIELFFIVYLVDVLRSYDVNMIDSHFKVSQINVVISLFLISDLLQNIYLCGSKVIIIKQNILDFQ